MVFWGLLSWKKRRCGSTPAPSSALGGQFEWAELVSGDFFFFFCWGGEGCWFKVFVGFNVFCLFVCFDVVLVEKTAKTF